MFKLLNLFRPTETEIAQETMRARFERVTTELNDVLSELEELPPIAIDAPARRIEIEAPDQFADEALALPKPTEAEMSREPSNKDESAQTENSEESNDNSVVDKSASDRSAA